MTETYVFDGTEYEEKSNGLFVPFKKSEDIYRLGVNSEGEGYTAYTSFTATPPDFPKEWTTEEIAREEGESLWPTRAYFTNGSSYTYFSFGSTQAMHKMLNDKPNLEELINLRRKGERAFIGDLFPTLKILQWLAKQVGLQAVEYYLDKDWLIINNGKTFSPIKKRICLEKVRLSIFHQLMAQRFDKQTPDKKKPFRFWYCFLKLEITEMNFREIFGDD